MKNGFVKGVAGWLSRHRAQLAAAALAVVLSLTQAQETPPPGWIAYARLTGSELQVRLSEGAGELVTRLHEFLRKRQSDEAPMPIIVRIWISQEGWIERSEFQTLGSPQADADLRALLAARALPQAPPTDMRQPLVLRLTLRPNRDYDPAQKPNP